MGKYPAFPLLLFEPFIKNLVLEKVGAYLLDVVDRGKMTCSRAPFCQHNDQFITININKKYLIYICYFLFLHQPVYFCQQQRNQLQIYLMDKYRVFDKIIKTKACTYFKAEVQQTRQTIIIKKLSKSTTWEQILRDKDLAMMKNSKLKNFLSIHEIVKDEDQFYIMMDHLPKNLQFIIKTDIDKQTIFKIGKLLGTMALNLSEKKIYPREIRPSHIFIDQILTIIKLGHLETQTKDIAKLDLVQLQDLRYLSPEQVLTSKQIDERSLVFNIGLIICDLILGKSLITANTKMQYIFEMTRLFPQERLGTVQHSEHDVKNVDKQNEDNFDKIIQKYNFSNEFIALLKQMLKIDRSERLSVIEMVDAWDVVVQNEKNYEKNQEIANQQAQIQNKPNAVQYPINDQIDLEIQFQFEQKPTLSNLVILKATSINIPLEKNVEDDVNQPIIIKQSKNRQQKNKVTSTKQSLNKTFTNGKPTISTIRKPQLTNYAMNQANLGIQMGMNPSIFSDNEI